MMHSLGHEVIVYSGEDNDAPCAEHVVCITKAEQASLMGVREPGDILLYPFAERCYNLSEPWWPFWNQRVLNALQSRIQPKDFLCLIGGGALYESTIAKVRDRVIPVEYAIGYAGVSANTHHCFGSSNWQHVIFGLQRYEGWRGRFYDRCIPHYFDPDEFRYEPNKDGYLLYLGKLKWDKGVTVASEAARLAGKHIIFAGQGPTPIPYGEVRNRYIGVEERRDLLAGASGLFVPSLYVEPFGMIAAEGLLSGTPIITTPWGGLGEINVHGETGYVCHTMQDFVDAARTVGEIDPAACRTRGMRYDMHALRHDYQHWFDDLMGLWGEGWAALR
jgi:glycosyltransferase involved in cell wall biosynthesis